MTLSPVQSLNTFKSKLEPILSRLKHTDVLYGDDEGSANPKQNEHVEVGDSMSLP